MSGLDPFNLVYDKLWSLVERNQELKSLVKVGNRIKFDNDVSTKSELSDADLPELALLVGGCSTFPRNSTARGVTRNYIYSIATGDYKIQIYNKIAFELFRSIIDFECELCPLQWCNCAFVQNAKLIGAEETILDDSEKGISGWIGLWTCEVEMLFPLNTLTIKNPAVG